MWPSIRKLLSIIGKIVLCKRKDILTIKAKIMTLKYFIGKSMYTQKPSDY
jgi:hypothetical protein